MVGDIFQPTHLLFVLVVALLVLGPKKLPEVGRQLGNGLRDFRAAINGERSEHEEVTSPYEEPASGPAPEHEFAHAPVQSSPEEHEFAHAPTQAGGEGHEVVHEASKATVDEHEFAHEPAAPAGDATAHTTSAEQKPAGGHEFAYEAPESADKRTDPA